jgi:hypothetical protein
MRASELGPLILSLERRAADEFGADGERVIKAIVAALDRFDEETTDAFLSRLNAVKPPSARKKAATFPQNNVVEQYIDQLRSAFGDTRSTAEIMRRLRSDKAVLKPEAIAIAKALGVPANSKTPKGQAFSQIEGLSAQRERDIFTADRIRKGA